MNISKYNTSNRIPRLNADSDRLKIIVFLTRTNTKILFFGQGHCVNLPLVE